MEMQTATTARPMDLNAICRLCLSDRKDSLKSLYDEILGPNRLPQKIELLLQLQVSRRDKLSTLICNDCIIRLDTWFAYKSQCHRNQAKLTEWLNISKQATSATVPETILNIKPEPMDPSDQDMPLKAESSFDESHSTDATKNFHSFSNSYFDDMDMDIDNIETEDERTCPDCGKVFGGSQNMRRHQNMLHAKKDRRCQMAEIPKSPDEGKVFSGQPIRKTEIDETEPIERKPLAAVTCPENEALTNSESTKYENGPDEKPTTNESESMVEKESQAEAKAENSQEDIKKTVGATEEDEKKILFAAGLKLLQKDASPIESEPLSKIELSYIEKCKAMVAMFQTFQCACHNVQHKTLRNLLSHLRETRIWFPLFTCYNCMISLTDRSTFTRHYSRCERPQLEALKTLSNIRKRSIVKTRLYQNFKCNRCKFMFSFHEDFCRHIEEDHIYGAPPYYCSCRYVFESLEEYKTHCYTSCSVSYYCDLCFETTTTVEEFIKHAQEKHDASEGFILLQDNQYVQRTQFKHKDGADEANVLEGKRERRKSSNKPILVQIYDKEIPPDLKNIPTAVVKRMIHLENLRIAKEGGRNKDTCCPFCKKVYSNANNMARHYRTHIEREEVDVPQEEENEDLYTCPDCGGVYPKSKFQQHVQEQHSSLQCSECDKEFQFQSELEQHRSIHLNLKVYRDSKTQAYKSAMVSPTSEEPDDEDRVLLMCEICDATFPSKEELRSHKSESHEVPSSANSVLEDEANSKGEEEEEEEEEGGGGASTSEPRPYCNKCDKYFSTNKSLREHALNKHGAEFWKSTQYPRKCEACGKVCTTGAAFKSHQSWHVRQNMTEEEKANSEFPKKCEYCDKMCTTPAGLYLHTQMHERVTLGELKKRKDDKKVKTEVPTEDEESYHTCKRCFKVFATKFKLREHLKSHGIVTKPGLSKRNRKVLCNLCHVALDNYAALAKHKQQEHNEDPASDEMDMEEDSQATNSSSSSQPTFECDICENVYVSRAELRRHKDSHRVKPKPKAVELICKYCKVSFDSVNALTRHLHTEHEESAKPKVTKEKPNRFKDDKPHKCGICNKGFPTAGALQTHSGWHKRVGMNGTPNTPKGDAQAKLEKKHKVLKKIQNAAEAIKSEPVEIPEFQCSTCFLELPNDTALQIHILEKHRDLDALMLVPRCDTCNQDFNTQDEYEKHKRFHAFLERQIKSEHDTIQTPIIQSVQSVAESAQANKIRYPCDWCASSFSRQDTLNAHIKNHHKEHVKTEFECDQCDRVFDKQNALTTHLKVHQRQSKGVAVHHQVANSSPQVIATGSGAKFYICSLCNMCFNYPKDLRMHTINDHPF